MSISSRKGANAGNDQNGVGRARVTNRRVSSPKDKEAVTTLDRKP